MNEQSMFLTHKEMSELTARSRRNAQHRALQAMGIEHRLRPDGTLAVLRAHVERLLGGNIDESRQKRQVEAEPNWNVLR